jgi:hypothetical protein
MDKKGSSRNVAFKCTNAAIRENTKASEVYVKCLRLTTSLQHPLSAKLTMFIHTRRSCAFVSQICITYGIKINAARANEGEVSDTTGGDT